MPNRNVRTHRHRFRPAPLRGAAFYECRCGAVARKTVDGRRYHVFSQKSVRQYDHEQLLESLREQDHLTSQKARAANQYRLWEEDQ